MEYRSTWNLTSIPDEVLLREYQRRRGKLGGRKITCHDPPQPETCDKCKQRLYRQGRRAEGKDPGRKKST